MTEPPPYSFVNMTSWRCIYMTDEFSAIEGMLRGLKRKNVLIKFGSGLPPLGVVLGKLTADKQSRRIALCSEGLEQVRLGRAERNDHARAKHLSAAQAKYEAAYYVQKRTERAFEKTS